MRERIQRAKFAPREALPHDNGSYHPLPAVWLAYDLVFAGFVKCECECLSVLRLHFPEDAQIIHLKGMVFGLRCEREFNRLARAESHPDGIEFVLAAAALVLQIDRKRRDAARCLPRRRVANYRRTRRWRNARLLRRGGAGARASQAIAASVNIAASTANPANLIFTFACLLMPRLRAPRNPKASLPILPNRSFMNNFTISPSEFLVKNLRTRKQASPSPSRARYNSPRIAPKISPRPKPKRPS